MPASPDRLFALIPFGGFRDMVLRDFRVALRTRTNPDTGSTFTEEELGWALAKGSRWWIGANAIEQVAQIGQARALWLAEQIDPRTASSEWIERYHAPLWLASPGLLDATGAEGTVLAVAANGTSFTGNATPEAGGAIIARDERTGRRFQVLATTVVAGGGQVSLYLFAIDPGADTNLEIGDILRWENPPANCDPNCTVTANFTGGTDRETDQQRVSRIVDAIRWKQGSGNWAQMRAWARDASNAVEDAFVYCCAMAAGTVLVSITQKRSGATGPLARIPAAGTLDDVRDFIVPPTSRVLPSDPTVVVVAPTSVPVDLIIGVYLDRLSATGWADLSPWPTYVDTVSSVTVVTTQTSWRMHADEAPVAGVTPALMAWDPASSRWERLTVTSVASAGGELYDVVLSTAPSFTIAVGTRISPYTALADTLAESIENYFDHLGPGEVVDTNAADPVAGRAYRRPKFNERWPQRAGAGIVGYISEALGIAADHAELADISQPKPLVPLSPEIGPEMLTINRVMVYAVND